MNDANQNTFGSTSQQSFKTSMSSLIDFDPEDDTQTSQQTAATELTQPTRSAARLVRSDNSKGIPLPDYP